MAFFPQLSTGAISQFPCTKRVIQRTVLTEQTSGRTLKLFDPDGCTLEWELHLTGLTSSEWTAIESLFLAVEGRLGSFGFLDPAGNLLKWSEELDAPTWDKQPGLLLSTGVSDPLGGARATAITNTASSEQSLRQRVPVPGWFQYCVSVYARSQTPQHPRVFATAGSSAASIVCPTGITWQRIEVPICLNATNVETIDFGIGLEPGGNVDFFGMQVDAQVGASNYKKTTTHNGSFPSAYFLDDSLDLVANGPDDFSCTLRIGTASR